MQKSKAMLYLLGYVLAGFLVIVGLGYGFSLLHQHSSLKPHRHLNRAVPLIRTRALISFSLILPFAALAFLVLTFAAMRIAQNQGVEGHFYFTLTSLFIPTLCFLIGFFYFRKVVRS